MPERMEPVTAVLDDGRQVRICAAGAEDGPTLAALYARLRDRGIHLRFPGGHGSVSAAARGAEASARSGQSVTAWAHQDLVGAAAYQTSGTPAEADLAIAVTDKWLSRGAGTLLLEHLISIARQKGIASFRVDASPDNSEMLRLLADLGYTAGSAAPAGGVPGAVGDGSPAFTRRRAGSVEVDLSWCCDEEYLEALAERESRADVASLRPVFAPDSVAVIGASRREASIGNAVVRHLLAAGFHGPVYPVNPHAERIAGLRAYPSVSALPKLPDLAVAAVPAAAVAGVAEECGQCGVGGLVVLSAGLSDQDAWRLRQTVRHYGMRMVGPDCVGVANTDPSVALDATFTRRVAVPGHVGVLTDSGGIGSAIYESLHSLGLGVSTFASVGGKYDVSGNDLLLWWRHDDRTKVAVICLESFGNPRKFARLARHLGRRVPLVVVRTPASMAAGRAARPDIAAPRIFRDEMLRQAGAIATDDLAEAIDAVAFFCGQPLPAGRRVALVGDTRGAGMLAVDACVRNGLQVPPLSAATQKALAGLLPGMSGAPANPVDTPAGAGAGLFGRVMEIVAADPAIDAIVPILTPTAVSQPEEILEFVPVEVPVAAVLLGQGESLALHGRVPVYSSAAAAARALCHAADYAQTRSCGPGAAPQLTGIDKEAATAAIEAYLARHPQGGWLDGPAVDTVVHGYGLPVPPSSAIPPMSKRPGTELLVGFVRDPAFGPLVQVSARDVTAGPVTDRSARLLPLTDRDARNMIGSLRIAPPPAGFRDAPVLDTDALSDALHRVARLAGDLHSVAELHIDPLILRPDGCVAADVKIRVGRLPVVDPCLRQLR